MSFNSFGNILKFTTFGESHGPSIGCIIDGVPPNLEINEELIQPFLDRRKPGTSKFVTQRKEDDKVKILSGVFDGKSTGTPIAMLIDNIDQRSKDYGDIEKKLDPVMQIILTTKSMGLEILKVEEDHLRERLL